MKTVKSYVKMSPFGRIFDSSNPNWMDDIEFNLVFLKAKENYLNAVLKARGILMLNDVYDELGFPRTALGARVGWIYAKHNQFDGNVIDLGLGRQRFNDSKIRLDFNVDGNINKI